METSAEPHREQKHRALPGEDSYCATSLSHVEGISRDLLRGLMQ
jgi:hypothetical protein